MRGTTIVHLVHGTWPYGWIFQWRNRFRLFPRRICTKRYKSAKRRAAAWFHRRSAFRKEVTFALGVEAIKFVSFRWSGANSFTARRDAAGRLRQHLCRWVALYPNACHLIVAHSHGGTVAVLAAA